MPPEYPYPIQVCLERGSGRWKRFVCALIGHVQCGLHWEENDERCCRCSSTGEKK